MKLPLLLLAATVTLAAAQNGKGVYSANCASCHQVNGQGVPGAFPPQAGHFPDLLNNDGGRAYVVNVVLYGLQGAVTVKGRTYSSGMPGFAQLSDADIAAVLNYVGTSWKNALPEGQNPFAAAEVQKERATKKTPAQVLDLRPKDPQ